MRMTVRLRLATSADFTLLAKWGEAPHVAAAFGADAYDWRSELAVDPDWRDVLIAEADGRAVGAMVVIDPALEPSRYWGEIAPGFRAIDIWIGSAEDLSRGYGGEMMRGVIARCFADPQVRALLVDPLAANTAAQRFYRRLGFRQVERRRFGDDLCVVYRLDRPRP